MAAVSAEQSHPSPTDIGPGSMLWHYLGDRRIGFTGLSAGILQLMHPEVGAGVANHSNFFNEPWERIYRSIPQILGSVYDADPQATARQIVRYHAPVHGRDEKGRYYNALSPETFWWTHAAFHGMVEDVIDRFSRRDFAPAERERLYTETTQWWRHYGLSMRPVPANYRQFKEKQKRIYGEVLEMTPAAEKAITMATDRKIDRLPEIPAIIWPLGSLPVSETVRLLAIGGLPPEVRKRFDIPWSNTLDMPRLRVIEESVKNGWRFLPPQLRYYGRARQNHQEPALAA